MLALPPDLYTPFRSTLCQCCEFHSYQALRAIFVTESLFPFRIGLPSADSPEELVDLCLAHLLGKRLSDGRSVLLVFVATLRDLYEPGDALRNDLNDLHTVLQGVMTRSTSQPTPTPRRKQMLFDRLLQLNFRPQVRLVNQQ